MFTWARNSVFRQVSCPANKCHFSATRSVQALDAPRSNSRSYCDKVQQSEWALIVVPCGSPTMGPMQGAVRREWRVLSKGCNTAVGPLWGSETALICGTGH